MGSSEMGHQSLFELWEKANPNYDKIYIDLKVGMYLSLYPTRTVPLVTELLLKVRKLEKPCSSP